MTKIKTKTLIKYLVLAYAIYLIYSLPKQDWVADKIILSTNKAGQVVRLSPNQSSYIKYMVAWWKDTLNNKGLASIVDEHILAPIGIKFED